MGSFIDLSGKRFGKWLVIKRDNSIKKKNIYWICKCDCGKIKSVSGTSLRSGISISCGCDRNQKTSLRTKTNIENLSGQRFGHWTVIRQDLSNPNSSKRGARWICRCDCGKMKSVLGYSLRFGRTKSCGCQNGKTYKFTNYTARRDLTGQQFGKLTVLFRDLSKIGQGVFWKCRCECGNIKSYKTSLLLNAKVVSCGCDNRKKSHDRRFVDISNRRYGRLVVVKIDHICKDSLGNTEYYWKCLCDCGNSIVVQGTSLRKGDTKSCGCLQSEKSAQRAKDRTIDLTGQRFGLLTVIERININNGSNYSTWKCLCDCGNEKLADGYFLKKGMISSCGCLKQSRYELYVLQYFDTKGYMSPNDFEYQKRFDDLRGYNKGKLSYDFSVYKNNKLYALIECQGEQHYKPIEIFGGEEQFKKQQLHDKTKRDYANKLKVLFIEIPYTVESYEDVKKILELEGI